MFDNLKKKLFFMRLRILQDQGVRDGELRLFEKELYEKLDNVYYEGIPLSLYFKYSLLTMTTDLQFEEKSLLLTMGFDDAKLVCGNLKNLELLHGKSGAKHYWVENDGWVYDTAFLYKFKKELYYKMYMPSDVKCCSKDQYSKIKWYQDIVNTKLEDLMPDGKYRSRLLILPSAKKVADYEAEVEEDDTFLRELNTHLETIQYDSKDVVSEEDKYTRKRTN